MRRLSLANLPLDSALRKMISFVKLPGESQRIERIIEAFSEQYCEYNPGKIDHPDTAFRLAFALCMLNTDAHSAAIKRKMTSEQFNNNLRDACKVGALAPI